MKTISSILVIGIYLICYATVTLTPITEANDHEPITEANVHELKGDWEGTRMGQHGERRGYAPVSMKITSISPIRAVLLFDRTPSGIVRYVLKGTIENGYIVGELKGKRMPTIKLGFHRKEGGRLELRGNYKAGRGTQFRGNLKLEKVTK